MSHKLENPTRVQELNPTQTLQRIGLQDGNAFCDIGAGTGLFTFAAATITHAPVYAVDVSPAMVEILREKKQGLGFDHVTITDDIHNVPSSCCHVLLLCTVLHELKPAEDVLRAAHNILVPGGTLAIIEFHKHKTPFGPPIERRLDPEQAQKKIQPLGFSPKEQFSLGKNFYTLLFTATSAENTL